MIRKYLLITLILVNATSCAELQQVVNQLRFRLRNRQTGY